MIRELPVEQLWLTREIAHSFFAESGLPGTLDFDYWTGRWQQLIKDLDIGVILVYEQDGAIKGILGGLCVRCTMTAQLEAIESFWYVMPEVRGSIGGVKLLKAFEAWAQGRGAQRIKMAYLTHVNPVPTASLYARMGYSSLESCVVKELT